LNYRFAFTAEGFMALVMPRIH